MKYYTIPVAASVAGCGVHRFRRIAKLLWHEHSLGTTRASVPHSLAVAVRNHIADEQLGKAKRQQAPRFDAVTMAWLRKLGIIAIENADGTLSWDASEYTGVDISKDQLLKLCTRVWYTGRAAARREQRQ